MKIVLKIVFSVSSHQKSSRCTNRRGLTPKTDGDRRERNRPIQKLSAALQNLSAALQKLSAALQKLSTALQKLSTALQNVSLALQKLSTGLQKVFVNSTPCRVKISLSSDWSKSRYETYPIEFHGSKTSILHP